MLPSSHIKIDTKQSKDLSNCQWSFDGLVKLYLSCCLNERRRVNGCPSLYCSPVSGSTLRSHWSKISHTSCSPWSTDTECRACCRPTQCHRFSTRRSNNLPTTARDLNLPRQSWACKMRLGPFWGWQQMNVIWLAVTVNVGDCRSRTWRCASGKQHHQACYLGPWDLVLRSPGKKAYKQTWKFGTAWRMTFLTIVDIF